MTAAPLLSFNNFVFGYSPTTKWGLTRQFLPGEICGLVGPNGVGKSTFLKAIAGILKPISGVAQLDGFPIQDMTRRSKLESFLYVPQQPEWIFVGADFSEHITWLSRSTSLIPHSQTQNNRDIVSNSLKQWPGIFELAARRLVDLSSEDIYILALAEDYLVHRKVLLLDECMLPESSEIEDFFKVLIRQRRARGDVTIIAGHSEALLPALEDEPIIIRAKEFVL